MMRSLLIICCVLSNCLLAQDSFQWADYRARYERRVRLTASIDYQSPNYSNRFGSHRLALPFRWTLARNLDERQLGFALNGGASLQWDNEEEDKLFQSYVSPSLEERRYHSGAFFHGSRTAMSVSQFSSSPYNLEFAPNLLLGWGRLERADDALLAHWIVAELPPMTLGGTTADVTSHLAHTITDLIGNRTFDQRRRRIYELEQLAQHLDFERVAAQDQLSAYSVLNDNWAFANRVTIEHGWQLQLETGFSFSGHPHRATLLSNLQSYGGKMELVYATIFPKAKLNLRTGWQLALNAPFPSNNSFVPAVRLYPQNEGRVELLYFPNSRHLLRTYVRWSALSVWTGDTWAETISTSQAYNTQIAFEWNLLLTYPWQLQLRTGWNMQSNYSSVGIDNKEQRIYLNLGTTYAFQ